MAFPSAFLFDFDGTIVDSEVFHFESAREILLRDTGKEMSLDYYMKNLAGVPMSKSSPGVIRDFGIDATVEELVHAFDSHTRERYQTHGVKFMPHAQEFISWVLSLDAKLAVVTGSGRRDVELTMSRLGLKEHFPVMITHDDVSNVKPHGEPYEKAISQLGVAKKDCVVFEDSFTGMTSAKNAGLPVFAIQENPVMAEKLSGADQLFKDFSEVLAHFNSIS